MTTTPISKQRSLWPIAIAIYFSIAILGIAIFVTWAVRQNGDLVRKDYYAEEMQFQRHLDQMHNARELAGKTQITFDRAREVVAVSLPGSSSSIDGQIHFYRPSDAGLDKVTRLALATDGSQQIDARNLQSGLWKVRVTWRADGKEFFSEETIVIERSHS